MSEVWFDTRLGELLIGEDAVVPRLEESMPGDVVPMHELLTTKDFPIDPKEFPRQNSGEWGRDEVIALGSATVKILVDAELPSLVNTQILRRLYYLGLGPYLQKYTGPQGAFPTMQDFRTAIGAEVGYSTRGKFDSWTTSDFADYAIKLATDLGHKPSRLDYIQRSRDDPNAPTITILADRFTKGVSELNEHVGYPHTKSWEADDYIAFGAKFVEVNGVGMLAYNGITALAGRRRGPGYASIMRKFPTFDGYKEQALSEYKEQMQQRKAERIAKTNLYDEQIAKGILPAAFANLGQDDLLLYGGRYHVSMQVAPRLGVNKRDEAVMAISSLYFVRHLLRTDDKLTAADVEVEASILGVYDDLWPMEQYKTYLKVTLDEAVAVRERKRITRQSWLASRRQSRRLP